MPLAETAARYGIDLDSRWGSLTATFPSSVDLSHLKALCAQHHYRVIAAFGDHQQELEITQVSLDQEEVNAVAELAASASDKVAVAAMSDGWRIAEDMAYQLKWIRVIYSRSNWCHSTERFRELISEDWLHVADYLNEGTIRIGEVELRLEQASTSTSSVLIPMMLEDSNDETVQVASLLMRLADVAAWRSIAVFEERRDGSVWLALCQDQPAEVKVDFEDADGGVDLWRWLESDKDANRNEALRHVLRFQTAISRQLPRASDVRTLAERHRLALSRENAAEVYRAVEESKQRMADALVDAKRRFSQYVEETTKVFQGTVVAATGLAVLVVRTDGAVPDWLLYLVAAAAVAGLALLSWSRWKSAEELSADLLGFGNSLANNPLLPDEERETLADMISEPDTKAQKLRVQRIVGLLGVCSAGIVVATVVWLVVHGGTTASDTSDKSETGTESIDAWRVDSGDIVRGCGIRQA